MFLVALFVAPCATAAEPRRIQKFYFRIKTKSGGIIGNVLIEGYDVEDAKVKLNRRYPECTILNVRSA